METIERSRTDWIHARALIAVAAMLIALPASGADETPFRPEACFPGSSLVYLRVGSVERFTEGARSTLFGRIASHPGLRAALGRLPELLREKMAEAAESFPPFEGLDLPRALGLLRGEVAAVLAGGGPGGPRFAVAIELGKGREDVLALLKRIDTHLEAETGGELAGMRVRGHPVVLWQLGETAVARAVLGTHVVFAHPQDFIGPIIVAHTGGPGEKAPEPPAKSLAEAPFLAALRKSLKMERPELLLALDIEGIRKAIQGPEAPPVDEKDAGEKDGGDEDLADLLEVTGLDRVNSAGLGLGFREGGLEMDLQLNTPGGARGFLQALSEAVTPLERPEEYLRHVPAAATQLSALRVHPGTILEWVRRIAEGFPELGGALEGYLQRLEGGAGISLRKELKNLPPVGFLLFDMTPPAGGLIDDSLTVLRTEEYAPYERVLGLLDQDPPWTPKTITVGERRIRYYRSLSLLDLGDGWMVSSGSLAALRRYVDHYATMEMMGKDPRLLQASLQAVSGADVAMVLQNARSNLTLYNTLVSVLNALAPSFDALLDPLGVDAGLLPPGEVFLEEAKDGWLRVEMGPEGLSLRGHRIYRNSGWMPEVAGASVLAGFLVPTILSARGRADEVRCQSSLREIQKLAMLDLAMTGNESYRHPAAPGPEATLEVLKAITKELETEIPVCPKHEEGPGYEIVPWALSTDGPPDAMYAFDGAPRHRGGRNVVYLDSSVELLTEEEFQAAFARDRERFGTKKSEKKEKDQ